MNESILLFWLDKHEKLLIFILGALFPTLITINHNKQTLLSINNRPLSGAQVKYRKNTDKKWAKIQKNTEKIQKNSLKYRTFCIFLKEKSCIREFFRDFFINLF